MKYCAHCGKEIADEAVICLNCGCSAQQRYAAINTSQYYREPQSVCVEENSESQLAIWAKICGIVSFFIGWFALGITAIVLANASKDDTNGVMSSSAKEGYICGIISTVLSFILFIAIVAVITSLSL